MKIRIAAMTAVAALAISACAVAQTPAQNQTRQRGNNGTGVAAQRQARPGQGMQALRDLGLTTEQQQKIRDIFSKYMPEVRTINQSTGTAEEKATKLKELKTKTATAINAVLNDEQKAKAAKDDLINKLLNFDATPGRDGMQMFAQLNLTAEQKTKIQPLVEANRKALMALRDKTDLTPEARRTEMRKINEDFLTKVKAVLTPEQIKKLEELQNRTRTRTRPGQQPAS